MAPSSNPFAPAADGFHRSSHHRPATRAGELPRFLIAEETAQLLRTTRKAVYALAERGQLPGVVRIGRRLLVRQDALVDWLDQKHAPSSKEARR